MGLQKRKYIGQFFLGLVNDKIAGKISQAELERRAREATSEQLSLGIGAATEAPRDRERSSEFRV